MKWLIYGGLAIVIIPAVVVLIGAALPKEHIASRKIQIFATPDEVFALIAGPSNWRGVRYELLAQSPLKWREDGITYERLETSPPKRLVNRIADPNLPFGGSWIYEIEPAGDGTELTITEHGVVSNPFFRFVSRFIMGHSATIEKYQRDLVAHFRK